MEAIDRKAGDAMKAFKDLVFPDDYNPGGKPAAKRKVFHVLFLFVCSGMFGLKCHTN